MQNRFLKIWRFLQFILKSEYPDFSDLHETKLEKYYPYATGYVPNRFFFSSIRLAHPESFFLLKQSMSEAAARVRES
jgi:hypothetical protein